MHCKVSHKAKLTYVVLCPCKPLGIYQHQDGTQGSLSDTLGRLWGLNLDSRILLISIQYCHSEMIHVLVIKNVYNLRKFSNRSFQVYIGCEINQKWASIIYKGVSGKNEQNCILSYAT